MEAAVVLFFAALAGAALVAVRSGRFTARRRLTDLRGFVRSHGWHFGVDDVGGGVGTGMVSGPGADLTRRWPGPPFHPGGGIARSVVSGMHRGRDFVAFEYRYDVTPSPTAKTAIPHRRTVVTVSLPAPVPDLAVTRTSPLGGVLARARRPAGADVVTETGGSGRRVHVVCADELFASTVLQPPVVQQLDGGPAWEWRFAGDTMIGYRSGRITPDRLLDGLDALADVLDRIPADAWRHRGTAF